jgi:CHAD domain-containing protein
VEVVAGAVADWQPFVDRMRAACGLQTAILSKYDLGLFARGLQPAGPPHLGPTAVHEAQSLGEVAFAVLRRHFGAFLAHEPGTRLGDDPEELHDMRVAARRLRAAMRLFAAALPARVPRLRQELRWVAAALGEVRDLDVQIEQIRAWIGEADPADRDALQTLAVLIERRRGDARRRMLRVLDSVRFERLVAAHIALLQRGPSRRAPEARAPVLQAAPLLVTRRYRKVRKLGGRLGADSGPAEYHALRIRCKQLRYALEFFREIYGKPAETLIERLVRLQDILGGYQDAHVAVAHLRELAVAPAGRLPPQAVFAMGGIAQRYVRQAADLQAEFPEAFRQFKGRPWRRLRRALEARQPAGPGPRAAANPPQAKSPSHSE